tara:strand:- start:713 stop:1858 length:1146 start_codon:yes stop_codon:yes gene_type:complete
MIVGQEPLSDLPVEKVQSIKISAANETSAVVETLNLTRGKDSWIVGNSRNYPADSDRIERFVKEFTEMKVLRQVSASAKQLERIHLLEPGKSVNSTATQVTFLGDDAKAVYTVYLGKEIAPAQATDNSSVFGGGNYPDRRFIMLNGNRETIAVVDQTFSNATPTPSDWLNKDFFKVDNPSSVAVSYAGTESTNSWKIIKSDVNGTAEWSLAGSKKEQKLDTATAPTTPFSSPSFKGIANEQQAASLDMNATKIEVGTSDGFQYFVTVSKKNLNGDYTLKLDVNASFPERRAPGADEKPEDKERLDNEWVEAQSKLKEKLEAEKRFNKWVFQVEGYAVESLLKKRSELIANNDSDAIPPPSGGATPLPPFRNLPPFQPNQGK